MIAKIFPLILLCSAVAQTAGAQNAGAQNNGPAALSLADAVERITSSENNFLDELSKYRPLTETYIQFLSPATDGAAQIGDDAYFLGSFEFLRGVEFQPFTPEKTLGVRPLEFVKRPLA